MLAEFDLTTLLFVGAIFLWTGFVRSGLGFGGAALGLPLLLFIDNQPLLWLPIIGAHLLFFSTLTLRTRIDNVDWSYLRKSSVYVIPPAVVGVLGLINLPTRWLLLFIYSITLFYSIIWILNWTIASRHEWGDKLLLILGGYVAGTTLSGAPLMVAVFMRNVPRVQLRNTLFVLWFILVAIKMSTFVMFGVDLHFLAALALLPIAAVGHMLGLKVHDAILANDGYFKRVIGVGLMIVSLLGLWKLS